MAGWRDFSRSRPLQLAFPSIYASALWFLTLYGHMEGTFYHQCAVIKKYYFKDCVFFLSQYGYSHNCRIK